MRQRNTTKADAKVAWPQRSTSVVGVNQRSRYPSPSGTKKASDPAAIVTANRDWLSETWQAMGQYASGAAYQNYVDPDLANWQQAYYGPNLPRLQRVKTTYDPNNFFHFAQSITPAH